MIYFDLNKKAYGYKIENSTCSIEENEWNKYAGNNNWDIVNGTFIDITSNPDYIEQINTAKKSKLEESNVKANIARYNKTFTLNIQGQDCEFDTSKDTQADLLTAFSVASTGVTYNNWITNNGINLSLTLEDINVISKKIIELSNVYPIWLDYYNKINACKTIAEVNQIQINYGE